MKKMIFTALVFATQAASADIVVCMNGREYIATAGFTYTAGFLNIPEAYSTGQACQSQDTIFRNGFDGPQPICFAPANPAK